MQALRSGLGPESVRALLEPQPTLPGVSDPVPATHPRQSSRGDAARVAAQDARRLAVLDARVLPLLDAGYPEQLDALVDAPPVLLVRGAVSALRGPSVAIVGARAATRSARSRARRLGRELAGHGLTIVSGLARGVDAEAHRGALEAGGRTVAVLACGIDRIYPPEHRELALEISIDGAVVSEVPLGTAPRRELFPLRNRVISGLSLGVIVVEARRRSGSLITVRHALDQGREVWVVPGAVEGPFAEGSNRLLRDGARAIRDAVDVVEDLGGSLPRERGDAPVAGRLPGREGAGASGEAMASAAEGGDRDSRAGIEGRILDILAAGSATREDLIARVELDPGRLAQALLELELAGRIMEERDGRFHARIG